MLYNSVPRASPHRVAERPRGLNLEPMSEVAKTPAAAGRRRLLQSAGAPREPRHDWQALVTHARTSTFAMHLHISKTGGTTMRLQGASVLRRKDCDMNLRDGMLPDAVRKAAQMNCSFISMECPVIRGPWVWDNIPWPRRGFTVTVLRNPIEQWLSVVRHTHRGISSFGGASAGAKEQVAAERSKLAQSAGALLRFQGRKGQSNSSYVGLWSGGHDPRNMQTRWLGPSLGAAISRISDDGFLVLINEFYDASICLMATVAGNWAAFEQQCHCGGHAAEELNKLPSRTLGKDMQGRSPIDGMSHGDMTTLTGWLADDFQLYAVALRVFLDDVAAAEEAVGQKFMCSGNEIGDAPYERWTNRPEDYG